MSGWIAMMRSPEAEALQERHPAAFLLLCQIARRARWRREPCLVTGLSFGQAMVGDWKKAGLQSEKSYRHALGILQRAGLVATQGTNRGTVASLVNQSIFRIEAEDTGDQMGEPAGKVKGERRADGRATKNTDTRKHLDGELLPDSAGAKPQTISWSLGDGFSGITQADRDRWAMAYPAVNIQTQLAKADAWLRANPAKAKKSQWARFLNSWLSRAQDRGGDIFSVPALPAPIRSGGGEFKPLPSRPVPLSA